MARQSFRIGDGEPADLKFQPSPCAFTFFGNWTLVVVWSLGSGVCSFAAETRVRVSDVTLFGDLECFKIETPSATYLYGKRGAGFASTLDPQGHDWNSYRPGGQALGEYRGLPKCGQPVKYFHCGYGFG